MDQLLDLAHHGLAGFDNSLFVVKCFFCRLCRPKIKIAFADQVLRVGHIHVFSDRPTGAQKMAFQILEIDLVRRVLEQKTKKILPKTESFYF